MLSKLERYIHQGPGFKIGSKNPQKCSIPQYHPAIPHMKSLLRSVISHVGKFEQNRKHNRNAKVIRTELTDNSIEKKQTIGKKHAIREQHAIGKEQAIGKEHTIRKENAIRMEHAIGKKHAIEMENIIKKGMSKCGTLGTNGDQEGKRTELSLGKGSKRKDLVHAIN